MIPNVDILSDAGHITFIFFTLIEYYKVFRFHFYTLLFCRAKYTFLLCSAFGLHYFASPS